MSNIVLTEIGDDDNWTELRNSFMLIYMKEFIPVSDLNTY